MERVSFDYDDTLDSEFVQSYAEMLIARGIEVWIVTARLSDEDAPSERWNTDLWSTAKKLKIPKERVVFMSQVPKYKYFRDNDFIWHLDDSADELTAINNYTETKGIWVLDDRTWMGTCERLLTK